MATFANDVYDREIDTGTLKAFEISMSVFFRCFAITNDRETGI